MSLRFIIGRAGAGKTRACLDQVREELLAGPAGGPLILLVPEQATFQTEYALACTPGLQGFTRAQVLSFRRLAYRVLQEVGGAARAHIGELGKRMVLRRLLEKRRAEFKIFRRSAGLPGFADTLARTLGEIKTYCISPEELALTAAALRGIAGADLLADKLSDLHLLYSDLEVELSDRFTDPDDYLNLLADRLEFSLAVRGGEVWVDGFSGFTPQEYRVLAALMRTANRVNITLCTDMGSLSGSCDETALFYSVRETYDTLCETAARAKAPVERPLALDEAGPGRYRNLDLIHLERYFFKRPTLSVKAYEKGVILAVAASPRAETEGVAREITTLCRDEGYRYRDIVVLLRDLDSYSGIISSVFADHHIPVFIDQKRPVMHHPLVELVRSALEVVTSGWSSDPVFRFLKTDLVPLTRDEVDLLENYVLAHGIRGSRWTDDRPWDYRRNLSLEEDSEVTDAEVEELEAINRIRRQAVAVLSDFDIAVRTAEDVRAVSTAVYDLCARLETPEILERWSLLAQEEGRLDSAREHAQVWEGLTAMLDQVVEALGEETLTTEEYAAILDAGFEAMRLGLIPPGLDQVVVCSLERSRSPEARAAFVMGVSDGVLPARVAEKGILSEGERERLLAAGLRLAPGSRRRVFDEQFLVYIAITRSSEKLLLSYPLANEEGGAIAPSQVVARIKELLPGVAELVWPVEPDQAVTDDLGFITNPDRSLSYLVARLREAKAGRPVSQVWWDVYSWFARSSRKTECAYLLASLFANNREGRLPAGLSRALYGRVLKTSVSGIERFRACPFAHFLTRGLKLRERAVFKLGAPDLGQFFHAALKLFGERVRAGGLDWGQLDREQCLNMAGAAVDELAPRLQSEILLSSARRRYLTGKLKKTVQRTALVLCEHSRRGQFRPVGLELAFGPDGELPAVTFTLSDGSEMILTGRIDRVDAAQTDEGVYLRVIDYKSGRVTINLSDIYFGLKLQLLGYLDVALRCAETIAGGVGLPGAILYFRMDDPLVRTAGEIPSGDEIEKKILKEFRMTGLVLADQRVVKMMDRGLAGESELIPVQIKKDGEFAARSMVLTGLQFELLRAYLRFQLSSAGEDIMNGVVDISPYRRGSQRSCRFCLFKPVCQFDILMEGNTYRVLKVESDDSVWNKLARLRGGEAVE